VIVTARQLEDLHRQNGGNGHVVLPYRARLTPLAQDWVKAKRVALGYSDVGVASAASAAQPAQAPVSGRAQHDGCSCAEPGVLRTPAKYGACACSHSAYLWWCDGPCGPAKAALTIYEKESGIKALDAQNGASQIVPVIKKLAAEVKAGHAAGGILMVRNAAAVMVYANRCPSLRAILGTCQDAVEQGIQQVAANVLVIEYPHKTLQQMKNMLGRFVKAKRELGEDVKRQLQELSSCA
jgi:ribose 5-phosphate isomerase RpiB